MIITIDTQNPLTEVERRVLSTLMDGSADFPTQSERQAAAKKAPAKKAAAKAEPEPEEPDDDVLGGPSEEDLMEQAVAKATELVSNDEADKVRAALKVAGAKRVSELKGDAIQTFLDEL